MFINQFLLALFLARMGFRANGRNGDNPKNYCIRFGHMIANNRSFFAHSQESVFADILLTEKSKCKSATYRDAAESGTVDA